jgi:diadenosine tetraphosphate (Ap4A) HIT family hydrolase
MGLVYDDNNIFAKILRGEIPCRKVYEDDHTLAFEDINAAAPVHTLVIPKGKYVAMTDFVAKASDAEIAALMRAITKVAEMKGVTDTGYRLLLNNGRDGMQSVPHLHFHILGGRPLGVLVAGSASHASS